MTGLYVGPAKVTTNAYLGGARFNRLYLGSVKIWQGWLAARGNVTANLTGAGTSYLDVPGLGAADGQSAVQGSPPSIVVQGSKGNAQVLVRCEVTGGTAPDSRVRILVNGSTVSTSGANGSSFTHTWTGGLNDSDLVRFQYYGEGAFLNRPTLKNTSYITIA